MGKIQQDQWRASSWYDFNLDGLTNELDREIIVENFGNHCKPGKTVKTPTTQSK